MTNNNQQFEKFTDRWDPARPKVQVSDEHRAFYKDRHIESNNGFTMLYSLDELCTGTKYYELWVADSTGKLVAYSRTEDIDLESEKEFRLDFLLDEV